MFNGDGNNYANNSGNSYTYVTNHISVADSFNTTHSHNGHGRGGMCGILAIVLGLGIPVAFLWFIISVLSEVLR